MARPPGHGGRAAGARRRAHGLGLADRQPQQRELRRNGPARAPRAATCVALPLHLPFWDKGIDGQAFVRYYDSTNPEARRYIWEKVTEGYRRYGIRAFWLDACEPEMRPEDPESNLYYLGRGREVQSVYPREHARGFAEGLRASGEEERAAAVPVRLGRQPAVRRGRVVGRHRLHVRGARCADPGRPEHRDLGDPVVDDGHRRFQRRRPEHRRTSGSSSCAGSSSASFAPCSGSTGSANRARWSARARPGRPTRCGRSATRPTAIIREQLRVARADAALRHGADGHRQHHRGAPMRALFLEFPDEEPAWEVGDEYMFGPDVLVAPVTTLGARERDVYLPEGASWLDAWTGEPVEANGWVTAPAPLGAHTRVPAAGRRLENPVQRQ